MPSMLNVTSVALVASDPGTHVKMREQTLAEDHPSRLTSEHVLASTYQANGQVKEAVSLLEQH